MIDRLKLIKITFLYVKKGKRRSLLRRENWEHTFFGKILTRSYSYWNVNFLDYYCSNSKTPQFFNALNFFFEIICEDI